MIKNIIFSGGGMKGWAYIGTIKALNEYIPFKHIEQVIGVSIGSLFGLLYILKIDTDFILDYIMGLCFKDLIDIDLDDILTNQSLLSGIRFTEIISEIISFKINPNVTFDQLRIHSKILFTVNALNIDDSKLEYFNYNLTPHVKVLDAVRASCNLPFLFPSYSINGKNYFDGGICNNCPVDLVDELFTIAFDISHFEPSSGNNKLYDFFNSLINISNSFYKKNSGCIIHEILDSRFKNQLLNINQTKDDIFNIYMNGYINSKNIIFKNYIAITC
jgi:predicted acylesterase/phospholipase RssA